MSRFRQLIIVSGHCSLVQKYFFIKVSRVKKKAIPLIATTLLATAAFTTQTFINEGKGQKVEAK